ncbi:hypothetical protein Kpho02_31920 [Kitasatospora phosalacinea]|uniref:Uncharacterized protein n=1 Tax=Kitasatospora phosalacinea TaxID=2065 RepID=A0A9W6V249_9ACTN|nr:hypothetical protein [Kitasatospora phosalacinea]GLW70893.1 hypothetical protein Kpho02_31920 [Kitasatospora phosalacinea]
MLVVAGRRGLQSGRPGGMLLAGAATGLLVHLLVPGPGHTGTRPWIAREPS